MEGIFDWVKSIVFYLILLTVVTHLLPGKKYEKYVRLFTGMLMIMIVIKPVTQVFSWDDVFDYHFLKQLGEGENFALDDALEMDFGRIEKEQLMEEYERQLEAFVSSQAGTLGLELVQLQAQIEEKDGILMPVKVSLEITGRTKPAQIKEIKIADIVAEETAGTEKEQVIQLRNIIQQYYGLAENEIQIVML